MQTGPSNARAAKATYFYTRLRGGYYPGLCASFAFIDTNHFVTISFGRRFSTLLLIDNNTLQVLDYLALPGRDMKISSLNNKQKRLKVFENSSGGAYFFIDNNKKIYIPTPDNNIYVVKAVNNGTAFDKSQIALIADSKILDGQLTGNQNQSPDFKKTTAIMPDTRGNLWLVTRSGYVGVMVAKNGSMIYDEGDYTMCTYNLNTDNHSQLNVYHTVPQIEKEKIKSWQVDEHSAQQKAILSTMLKNVDEVINRKDTNFTEEIENSFCSDLNGNVYIASSFALYKFTYTDDGKNKQINSLWPANLYTDKKYNDINQTLDWGMTGPVYCNVQYRKPGQINAGTGTTPTYLPGRGIAYMDNSFPYMHLVVQDEDSGLKTIFYRSDDVASNGTNSFNFLDFTDFKYYSACENAVAAFGPVICAGSTLGYTDPFSDDATTGGILKVFLKDTIERFNGRRCLPFLSNFCFAGNSSSKCHIWPVTYRDTIDAKTATPQIALGSGLYYYYNQQKINETTMGNWQLSAFSLNSNLEAFHIQVFFDNNTYQREVDPITKFLSWSSGVRGPNAQKKYFTNNLWATFTLGPDKSALIATAKGFIKVANQ